MTNELRPRVGVIGHGVMGAPMASRLHEAGYEIAALDRSEYAQRAIVESGYVLARSPAELAAASNVIFIVVGFDDEVRELVGGSEGLFTNCRQGSVVVVSSTISPSLARELSALFATRGVEVVDAPLIRGGQAAIDGTLLITVGGSAEAFDRIRPILNCLATDVVYLGAVGAGQVGKALNNYLLWACQAANEEVFELCRAEGVEEAALQQALILGSGDNGPLHTFLNSGATFRWAEKDMAIVLQLADEASISVPLAGVVRERVKAMKYVRGKAVPTSTARKLEVLR